MRTPAALAASRSEVPAATATCRPSIVSVTRCPSAMSGVSLVSMSAGGSLGRDRRGAGARAAHRASLAGDVRLELVAELLDAADDRGRARIAEHADRLRRHAL